MKITFIHKIILCSLLLEPGRAFGVPIWARSNATKRDGSTLTTVCSGTGPSVDLARGEAIRGCKVTASDMLRESGTVRSSVFETNQDVSFQQSVEESTQFQGLSCYPLKEDIEEIEPGKMQVWLQCRFDLTQASVGDAKESKPSDSSVPTEDTKINMSSLKEESVVASEDVASTERIVINIASVPGCRSLTIRGSRPRVVKCLMQPAPVIISPSDDSIVIEAKGYFPKTLDLKLKNWKNHESIQVILDKR